MYLLVIGTQADCTKCKEAYDLLEKLKLLKVAEKWSDVTIAHVKLDEDADWLAEFSLYSIRATPAILLYKVDDVQRFITEEDGKVYISTIELPEPIMQQAGKVLPLSQMLACLDK